MCYRDGDPKHKNDMNNDMRLLKIPPFYKLLVYTFNVPSCIASPFYEYKDFEDWIELKGEYANIPDPKKAGVKRFITALFWIIIVATLGGIFNVKALLSPDFKDYPWYKKVLYQLGTIELLKFTYYTVWCIVDSGMILGGLAYNGVDKQGNILYNRYTNVTELNVELGYYVKSAVYAWNTTIQYWMKKYVYMRLISKDEKPPLWKFFLVFVISAFWHGFYPSYYFFFFYVGTYLYLSAEVKYIYSYYLRSLPSWFQIGLAFCMTLWINLYIGSSFMMFHPSQMIEHYNILNWYGHILLAIFFALNMSPIGVSIKKHALKKIKEQKVAENKVTTKKVK